jgi:hypothetical protein
MEPNQCEGPIFQEMVDEVINKSVEAAKPAPEKKERAVGPEAKAVRIFREIFLKSSQSAGRLKTDLDAYLKAVLEDKDTKRGDRTYARRIYEDALRVYGGGAQPLPDWAKKHDEPSLSDTEIKDILSAAEEPLVFHNPATETYTMDVDALDSLMLPAPDPVEEMCEAWLNEFMRNKGEYPFYRVFDINQSGGRPAQRYIALGTVLGTVGKGKYQGKKINIHCTVAGFRTLRDAESEHAYYVRGSPLHVKRTDSETGLTRHIFCLRFKPGLKIRFWFRVDNRDVVERAAYLVCGPEKITVTSRDVWERA